MKTATYITNPQRIYSNPENPSTSDYVEILPVTTSDAVMVEDNTNQTLTERLLELGSGTFDVRNVVVKGTDIVKLENNNFVCGNFTATIAKGFTTNGSALDVKVASDTYTAVPTIPNYPAFLMVDELGDLFFSQYFDGGKSFPANPVNGQLFFNTQLYQVYKYTLSTSTWDPFPCVAIAKFSSNSLETIFPFNTWWWDEIIWEDAQPDFPSGLTLSHYLDTENNIDYLCIDKGFLTTPNYTYSLKTKLYKRPAMTFTFGTENGSSDGSYTNVSSSIIPSDITSTNLQGFSISTSDGSSNVFSIFNSSLTTPWGAVAQTSLTITFPSSYSINSYSIGIDATTLYRSHPQQWVLLGTNDNSNWEVIDSIDSADYSLVDSLTFKTSNNKKYNTIKFIFLASADSNGLNTNYLNITSLSLFTATPKLNVFLITDGNNTDVITSANSTPFLPNGIVDYHQIGTVCIDEDGLLFNIYPQDTLSNDAVNNYKYITDQLNKKADCDLLNISSKGLSFISDSCFPNALTGSVVSLNTVGFTQHASYLRGLSASGVTIGNITVYASQNITEVTNEVHSAIIYTSAPVAINENGSPVNTLSFIIPIPKGFYYKYTMTTGDINAYILPATSNIL